MQKNSLKQQNLSLISLAWPKNQLISVPIKLTHLCACPEGHDRISERVGTTRLDPDWTEPAG